MNLSLRGRIERHRQVSTQQGCARRTRIARAADFVNLALTRVAAFRNAHSSEYLSAPNRFSTAKDFRPRFLRIIHEHCNPCA